MRFGRFGHGLFGSADRRTELKEQRSAEELRVYAAAVRLSDDARQAAWIVFDAVGLPLVFPREITKVSQLDVRELAALAGIGPALSSIHRHAYVCSQNWVHLPGDAVIDLARQVARVHSDVLLTVVSDAEALLLERIRDEHELAEALAREFTPLELIRQWARCEG